MTATIMSRDITSDLPDLTGVSLDDLRYYDDPALRSALRDVRVEAESIDKPQDQRR
jgi:FXSXX-COOH protein